MIGRIDGIAASAGLLGEVLSSNVVSSTTNLTSNQYNDCTSLAITPGSWEVGGTVCFAPAATTSVTVSNAGYSTTSGNSSSGLTEALNLLTYTEAADVHAADYCFVVPTSHINLSATTTYYLKAKAVFTLSTMTCGGTLRALRSN